MNHNEIIKNEIRFYLDFPVTDRNNIQFPKHLIHQFTNVLKRKKGDSIFIFNGKFKELSNCRMNGWMNYTFVFYKQLIFPFQHGVA